MVVARLFFKRLLLAIPLILVISFITLFFIHLAPGNFFDNLRLNPQISESVIQQYEQKFQINENVFIQYFYWLKGIVTLDFGYSFAYQEPVFQVLLSRLGNTFVLSLISFLLSWLIAIPLGIFAAVKKGGLLDRFFLFLSYLMISIPGFLFAILLIFVMANYTSLPVGGMRSVGYEFMSSSEKIIDLIQHLIIPVTVLSVYSIAYLFRLMRAHVLDVMQMEFVYVLRARGLSERTILKKHVVPNALNPLISVFGLELPALFSGAALIEIMTGWPGLGVMMLEAVRMQDLYLVMGNMVMISLLLIIGNFISDVLLSMNDPRTRSI